MGTGRRMDTNDRRTNIGRPGHRGQDRGGMVSGGVLSGDGKGVVLIGRLTDRDANPAMVGLRRVRGRSQDEGRDRSAGIAGSTGRQIEFQSAAGLPCRRLVTTSLPNQPVRTGGRRPRYRCLKTCSGAVAGSARAEPKGSVSRCARPSRCSPGPVGQRQPARGDPAPGAPGAEGDGGPGWCGSAWVVHGEERLGPRARAALLRDTHRVGTAALNLSVDHRRGVRLPT